MPARRDVLRGDEIEQDDAVRLDPHALDAAILEVRFDERPDALEVVKALVRLHVSERHRVKADHPPGLLIDRARARDLYVLRRVVWVRAAEDQQRLLLPIRALKIELHRHGNPPFRTAAPFSVSADARCSASPRLVVP